MLWVVGRIVVLCWQKYDLVSIFIWRLSMVEGAVYGCQVVKSWACEVSFKCQQVRPQNPAIWANPSLDVAMKKFF